MDEHADPSVEADHNTVPVRLFLVVTAIMVALIVGLTVLVLREETPTAIPPATTASGSRAPANSVPSLNRNQINVIVSNGSGVAGAGAEIVSTLIDLGYAPVQAADPTVDPSQTPLDTIYFAANTMPDALLVAANLGVADSAVAPYPEVGSPVPIDASQVVLLLGSAPGMLATSSPSTSPDEVEAAVQSVDYTNNLGTPWRIDYEVLANQTTNEPNIEISPDCSAAELPDPGTSFTLVRVSFTNLGSREDFAPRSEFHWRRAGDTVWDTFDEGLVDTKNPVVDNGRLGGNTIPYECTPDSLPDDLFPRPDDFDNTDVSAGETVSFVVLLRLSPNLSDAYGGVAVDDTIGAGTNSLEPDIELAGAGPAYPNVP